MADDFFRRCGLAPELARAVCWDQARAYSTGLDARARDDIYEAGTQGYCSYTLFVGSSAVLQFRSLAHQIDVRLAALSRDIYGSLAPETEFLGVVDVPAIGGGAGHTTITLAGDRSGSSKKADSSGMGQLYAYSMVRLPGVSLSEVRSRHESPLDRGFQETLIRGFAQFICRGWKSALDPTSPELQRVRGRVGSSLRWRLEMMHRELPERFRPVTEKVLKNLDKIEGLPWVLTHGDLVPGNIMVEASPSIEDQATGDPPACGPQGSLLGLLDWAEAEYLPFGVGLYGAEELFGQASREPGSASWQYPPPRSHFTYYPWATELRHVLWNELRTGIPELADDTADMGLIVEQARVLGILLWHGIAFDDGKLNRVVQEGRDDEEIQRLDTFLSGLRVEPRGPDDSGTPVNNGPDPALLGGRGSFVGRLRASAGTSVRKLQAFLGHVRPDSLLNKL